MKSRSIHPLTLFFSIFKIVLSILGPLQFHMNFRVSLSISAETTVGILTWVVLSLKINLVKYFHLNNIKFPDPWIPDVYLFRCSLISLTGVIYSFSMCRSCTSSVKFIAKYFILYDAIMSDNTFLVLLLHCLLLVYRNTVDFCIMLLYYSTLLNLFILVISGFSRAFCI